MSWDPETVELREGEHPDVSAHAMGNIEQLRKAAREGDIDPETADAAIERIIERDD